MALFPAQTVISFVTGNHVQKWDCNNSYAVHMEDQDVIYIWTLPDCAQTIIDPGIDRGLHLGTGIHVTDAGKIVIGGVDGTFRFYDPTTQSLLNSVATNAYPGWGIGGHIFNNWMDDRGEDFVAIADDALTFSKWYLIRNGAIIQSLSTAYTPIFGSGISLGPNYAYAATQSGDKAILYSLAANTVSQLTLSGVSGAIEGIGYDEHYGVVVIVDDANNIYVYSADLSTKLRSAALSFNPRGMVGRRTFRNGQAVLLDNNSLPGNYYIVDLAALTVMLTMECDIYWGGTGDFLGGAYGSDATFAYINPNNPIIFGASHFRQSDVLEYGPYTPIVPTPPETVTAGQFIGATYRRSSAFTTESPAIIGWHRHSLGHGRTLTSIGVSSELGGILDHLDMVTTDATNYFVEGLTQIYDEDDEFSDAWFVDGGLVPDSAYEVTVSGVTGIRFTGLWWLRTKSVAVWALGLDLGDFTVDSSGTVFVPYGSGTAPASFDYSQAGQGAYLFNAAYIATNLSSSNTRNGAVPYGGKYMPCCVGHAFTSDGQAVRPIAPDATGSKIGPALGELRRSHYVKALLHNTLGIEFGTDFTKMQSSELKDDAGTKPTPTEPFSGVWRETLGDDYSFDSMVAWRIVRPYPAAVVSIGASIETQDA